MYGFASASSSSAANASSRSAISAFSTHLVSWPRALACAAARDIAVIGPYASAVRTRGIGATLAVAAVLGASAVAAAAASDPRPIHPVLGDWEGVGPHGVRMSFEFARRAAHVVVLQLALGLPTGCRSPGNPAWDVGATPNAEYVAPGSALHGPFPPLGATQFELVLGPTRAAPFPVLMQGRFSDSRHGALSIPRPVLRCAHGGWPARLRFALAAAQRVPVADGLWTGGLTGPGGAGGTVRIRVIDDGRIETDFQAAYACPSGGNANFEIGPLPTIGFLIAADGTIGGMIGSNRIWSGRFAANGQIAGNVTPVGCVGSPAPYAFTASRTGP